MSHLASTVACAAEDVSRQRLAQELRVVQSAAELKHQRRRHSGPDRTEQARLALQGLHTVGVNRDLVAESPDAVVQSHVVRPFC